MNELIGNIISGRYRVDAFLGKGGMAEVYKVWDQHRSAYLAMKILHADLAEDKVFLRRFRREAQTLSKLQHPNIVRFYGLEQDGDLVFILMDYVEGTTLRKEIFQSSGPFSNERILEIMRPVCAALYYAHKSGFVHCDVKPANIMIHKNGTIYVSDFGIARMTEAATVTMVGAGTPAYMAPEQARGEEPIPQTDIYALGVTLFEMLTGGERPFTGEHARTTGSTSEKIRWEQTHLSPPSPQQYNPSISSDLEGMILRCLEKDTAKRYPGIQSLLSVLEQSLLRDASRTRMEHVPSPTTRVFDPAPGLTDSLKQGTRSRSVWAQLLIAIPVIILLIFMAGGGGRLSILIPAVTATLYPTTTPYYTPTPSWRFYDDSTMGFAIEYPPDWVYQADSGGNTIVFASSNRILEAQDIPSSGAALVVSRARAVDTFPQANRPYSPAAFLDEIISQSFQNASEIQSVQSLYINSYPAATGLYRTSTESGVDVVLYMTVVVDNQNFALLLGLVPESDWQTYRPTLERMRDSVVLTHSPTPANTPTAIHFEQWWIAFDSNCNENNYEIYVISSDGTGLKRLTNNSIDDGDSVASPDGKRVAFFSERGGDREIYTANIDGINVKRLTYSSGWDGNPAWSPDGKRIAFTSWRAEASAIYIMNDDGSDVRRLTSNPLGDWMPSWSPDGNQIVYASWVKNDISEIFVINSDGSNRTQLTHLNALSFNPRWSPDSNQIIFNEEKNGEVHVISTNGNDIKSLGFFNAFTNIWSPDSQQIAFWTWGGDGIYIMNVDGSNVRLIRKTNLLGC